MTIGIIGAMPSELVDIRKFLGEGKIQTFATYEYHVNELNGNTIVSSCSGIGKVNAALCAQNLINNFKIDYLINAGIAGGMDNSVKVCDIVISKDVMHHDLLTRFLENYPPYNGRFIADDKLINLAKKSCEKNNITYFVERIVSGEVFISDNNTKRKIKEEFNPFAVDMESAAIAHCAYLNKIPFITIRCISDNADDNGELSFDKFEIIAAKKVAEITYDLLTEI